MRHPSIQSAATVSAALHLSIVLLTLFAIKGVSRFELPEAITVSLVEESTSKSSGPKASAKPAPEKPAEKPEVKPAPPPEVKTAPVARVETKKPRDDSSYVQDRVAALAAKQKIRDRVRARQEISVGDSEGDGETGGRNESIFSAYYKMVRERIRGEWVYPGTDAGDMEVAVAVTILKDGTLRFDRVEKSSGDGIFDSSALKALKRASPVDPPPPIMGDDDRAIVFRFRL